MIHHICCRHRVVHVGVDVVILGLIVDLVHGILRVLVPDAYEVLLMHHRHEGVPYGVHAIRCGCYGSLTSVRRHGYGVRQTYGIRLLRHRVGGELDGRQVRMEHGVAEGDHFGAVHFSVGRGGLRGRLFGLLLRLLGFGSLGNRFRNDDCLRWLWKIKKKLQI